MPDHISQLVLSKIQNNGLLEDDVLSALRLLYPTLITKIIFTLDPVIGLTDDTLSPSPEEFLSDAQMYGSFFKWLGLDSQDQSKAANAGALSFLKSYARLHQLTNTLGHKVRCRYEWQRHANPPTANLILAIFDKQNFPENKQRLLEPPDSPKNTEILNSLISNFSNAKRF